MVFALFASFRKKIFQEFPFFVLKFNRRWTNSLNCTCFCRAKISMTKFTESGIGEFVLRYPFCRISLVSLGTWIAPARWSIAYVDCGGVQAKKCAASLRTHENLRYHGAPH